MPQRSNIVGDLGTTKLASDSYDVDNIYLTEEGWVYRHFKSTDGTRYWDEIIVAGEVPAGDSPQATNPPKLGTVASPAYETGDGSNDWEYSEHQVTGNPGTYTTKIVTTGGGLGVGDGETPAVGDIGVISGTAPSGPVLKGVAGAYTVAAENAAGVTFTWTTSDGDGVLSATTGASVQITWATGGAKTVTVTATKAGAGDTGVQKTYNEAVTEYTIGSVNVGTMVSVGVDTDTPAVAVAVGGNVDDLVYAWTCTSANAANATFGDATAASTQFQASVAGDYTVQCSVSSAKAAGASGDGTSPVVATKSVTITA